MTWESPPRKGRRVAPPLARAGAVGGDGSLTYTSLTGILTRKYILVLALLFAVSLAAFLIFQELLRNQVSAEVVNFSGRERMLTHRIALYSTLLVGSEDHDPVETRAKLLASIDELRSAHDYLVGQRDRIFGFRIGRPSDRDALEVELARLDASIDRVISDAIVVATTPMGGTALARNSTSRLVEAATVDLIADLERVVAIYQGISETRMRWLHTFAVAGEVAIASLLFSSGSPCSGRWSRTSTGT